MSDNNTIRVKGARVNNLKNISVDIPRDRFVTITGVSGSGKSSLAFDTLYAEGQRRYVESLSSYARQFLGRMNKPDCDFIEGLPPAIAIEQKVVTRNSRSTVGTSTEIYDYLRLLYARIGKTISPISGVEVRQHTIEDVVQAVQAFSKGTRFCVLSPVHKPEKRTMRKQLEMYIKQGYSRIYANGDYIRIDDFLDANKEIDDNSALWLLIDRMAVSDEKDDISRLTDSVETAYYEGAGACRIQILPSNISYDFSMRFEADGMTFEKPSDNLFSFNSPLGACEECEGYGSIIGIDEKLVIHNTSLSVYDGCVRCWHGDKMSMWKDEFCRRAAKDNFPIFTPYYDLTREEKDMLWHGLPSDKNLPENERVSIDSFFNMVRENQYKIQYRVMMSRYRGKTTCPKCRGTRLKAQANYVKINGRSITDLVEMPVKNLKEWFDNLPLTEHEETVGKRLLDEIRSRLHFLLQVGLGYLTLNRASNTLSGGESQRINLTTSLGSSLVGSLYILDEPSIGLHSRDTGRLIAVLKELRDVGNTVIVVEHDEEIMRSSDHIIDIGRDAGINGGNIVFQGDTKDITKESSAQFPDSHTLKYLSGEDTIEVPKVRRTWNRFIELKGARMNNLRGIDVKIPLNIMTVVTGVSGSGKSSLIRGTLYPAMKRRMDEVADIPGDYSGLGGDLSAIHHVEFVDQNPIGKSSRSNPVTYFKVFDIIRDLYANQQLSRQMGFTPQYFSFNVEGGRCEECKGAGVINVEMQFMADLTLECDECHGKRFKKEILDVKFHGKDINDILNMSVDEAIAFFASHKEDLIASRLQPLHDVGLGYIKLGQSSSTLSGGENQRVKLAYYIGHESQSPTLFIFDEPTTGLHFHDIQKLLDAFNALIEHGHTILVIEHNMDIIKCADHIIDLGPDGGNAGGTIVCCGTPEDVVQCKESITGRYLKEKLK